MMEELERLSSEKKMLTQKLTRVTESYHALQKHFDQLLINKNTDNSHQLDLISRVQSSKRTALEMDNCVTKNNNSKFNFSGGVSSECSEDLLLKRPKVQSLTSHQLISSPKVSKAFVRTHASDPSLVSHLLFHHYVLIKSSMFEEGQ